MTDIDLIPILKELLTTEYARDTLRQETAEKGEPQDTEAMRERLRDILDCSLQDDYKNLDKEAPQYVKAVVAEIQDRFDDKKPKTLKDVWYETDGRGYYCILGRTQEILDDIYDDLDRILKKMDSEAVWPLYRFVSTYDEPKPMKDSEQILARV